MERLPRPVLVMRALEVVEKKIGLHELALRLGMPPETVTAWRDGMATMPERKFLKLVDVLTDLDPSWREWEEKS
jgi:hypothetical protein